MKNKNRDENIDVIMADYARVRSGVMSDAGRDLAKYKENINRKTATGAYDNGAKIPTAGIYGARRVAAGICLAFFIIFSAVIYIVTVLPNISAESLEYSAPIVLTDKSYDYASSDFISSGQLSSLIGEDGEKAAAMLSVLLPILKNTEAYLERITLGGKVVGYRIILDGTDEREISMNISYIDGHCRVREYTDYVGGGDTLRYNGVPLSYTVERKDGTSLFRIKIRRGGTLCLAQVRVAGEPDIGELLEKEFLSR